MMRYCVLSSLVSARATCVAVSNRLRDLEAHRLPLLTYVRERSASLVFRNDVGELNDVGEFNDLAE